MRRPRLDDLPPVDARVRLATHNDIPALARVLSTAFAEEWSESRATAELLDHDQVPATFVAVEEGKVVATASYQLNLNRPNAGWVHWVGADPAVAGRRLGHAVTLSVLHAAQTDGKTEAGLTTDDPRLAAIRTYLSLGFEPEFTDDSHAERWRQVFSQLSPP